MRKFNSRTILLSAFLFVAFMFATIQEGLAAEKVTLSVQNRYAENGTYYADIYATVPDGVAWGVGSQTIVLSYNTNALSLDSYDGVGLSNLNSSFSGYINNQTQWAPGQIALNLAIFSLPPYVSFENETFMIATLRWDVVDGTLMDNLQYEGSECQMSDDFNQLSYNQTCDQETCFKVDQPTSQQVALPVPTLDSPADMAMGQATNLDIEWNAVNHEAVDSYDVQVSTDNTFSTTLVDDNTTSTSYALAGLDNGTTYYWRVRSSDDDMGITSDWSLPWEFKTMISAPTLASPADGTLGTTLTPTLSWDPVTGADGYILYVEDQLGTVVQQIVPGNTSYDVTANDGLDYYTEYEWYVVAFEDVNGTPYESAPSAEWMFRTQVGTPNLVAPLDNANGLETTVDFEWSAVNGAAEYVVEISPVGVLGLITYYPTTNTLTYDGLAYCDEFQWRVSAVDADDNPGEFSPWFTFETMPGAPSLVAPMDASTNVPMDVTLEWAPVDCATEYVVTIEWGEGQSHTETVTGTTFDYMNYDYFTDYTWYVVANDQYGNPGVTSDAWMFRTMIGTPDLVAPANNANGVNPTVDFEWTAVNGADEYLLELSYEGSVIEEITTNNNMITWPGLDYCDEYSWRVAARDAEGNYGAFTAPFTFETMPGAPMLIAPMDNGVNIPMDMTLEWDAIDCATYYEVTLMWGEGQSHTEVVTDNYYDYPNFEYLTDYSWYVVAYDQYDNPSEDSETWTFQTIIEKPEVPVLSSPADMATEVVLTGDVEWFAADRAENYDVEIATDDAFANVVHTETGVTGLMSSYVGLDNDTDHWWRVRANNVGGTSDWSTVFEFKTMLLAPPMITNPTNGMQNVLLAETVTWENAQGAVAYNLQLSDDANFGNLLYDEQGLTTNAYDVTLNYGTTYYLRMQSIDEVDNLSNWGVVMFTTIAAPSFEGPTDVCDLSIHSYQAPDLPGATYTWNVTGGTYTVMDYRTIEVEFGDESANVALERTYGNLTDNTNEDIVLNDINYVTVEINAYHMYQEPCVNEEIDFDATITGGTVHTYMWDFDDGSTMAYGANPSRVFPGAGTYTVTLHVEGDDCTLGSATFDITIADDCPITITANDFTGENKVCKYSSPVFDVHVFGGNGNYMYDWTPAADFFNPNVEDAQIKNVLVDRTYTLKIEDGNGLYAYAYPEVEVDAGPSVSLPTLWYPFPSAGSSINLNSKVSNFDSDLTYVWGDGYNFIEDPENVTVGQTYKFYYVFAQDGEGGCPSTIKRILVIPAWNKQVKNEDVAISLEGTGFAYSYPNPVKDFVTLGAEFVEPVNASITIMTMAGQKLTQFDVVNTKSITKEIDFTGYSSGVYLIMIDTGSDTIVKKIVKE